jgi:hypothetical protein
MRLLKVKVSLQSKVITLLGDNFHIDHGEVSFWDLNLEIQLIASTNKISN